MIGVCGTTPSGKEIISSTPVSRALAVTLRNPSFTAVTSFAFAFPALFALAALTATGLGAGAAFLKASNVAWVQWIQSRQPLLFQGLQVYGHRSFCSFFSHLPGEAC